MSKIATYILTLFIFSGLYIALIASDNDAIVKMSLRSNIKFCQEIKRDFLKKRCYSDYARYEASLCSQRQNEQLKNKCLVEAKENKRSVDFNFFNYLYVVLEFLFIIFLSIFLLGKLPYKENARGSIAKKWNKFIDFHEATLNIILRALVSVVVVLLMNVFGGFIL